jgi:branched-chain amino acid transport system ATP-binding protein
MSLLQVEHVTKRFGSLLAVDNVSMSVASGELRAVIGPNGAGKTTFFNLVTGFLRPDAGRIVLDDHDVTDLLPARRVWRGLARTFQITEVFPRLTVRENLQISVEVASGFRMRMGLSREERLKVRTGVDELLEWSGLARNAGRAVGELSHGDQRTAEIMMALALNPRLLLLDEPTAGMGDRETYEIAQLIGRLHREKGLAIILIEHDMRLVLRTADRLTVLDRGVVLADGPPAEIVANEMVQAAYLGKAVS